MKLSYSLLFIALFGLASCGESTPTTGDISTEGATNNAKLTKIEWEATAKNYGTIKEGQTLEVSFSFKNVGDQNLVIKSVLPSCGCTAAEPPAKPIPPGGTGEITASFDSKGRPGANHKDLIVEANTEGSQTHKLVFDVNVD